MSRTTNFQPSYNGCIVVPLLSDRLIRTTLGRQLFSSQFDDDSDMAYLIKHQADTKESSMDGHVHASLRWLGVDGMDGMTILGPYCRLI